MNSAIKAAYNAGAAAYRKRYDAIPPRVEDVNLAFSYVDKKDPRVFEIGCAYGREAQCIVEKVTWYLGIDISSEYIKMAQNEVPRGTFDVADVVTYDFPADVDVVFAFASLLHLPKEDMRVVLQKTADSLNKGGVVFLSLKHRNTYQSEEQNDGVTIRRFYYYTREVIHQLMPTGLTEVFYEEQSREEEWFTMILQKKQAS